MGVARKIFGKNTPHVGGADFYCLNSLNCSCKLIHKQNFSSNVFEFSAGSFERNKVVRQYIWLKKSKKEEHALLMSACCIDLLWIHAKKIKTSKSSGKNPCISFFLPFFLSISFSLSLSLSQKGQQTETSKDCRWMKPPILSGIDQDMISHREK